MLYYYTFMLSVPNYNLFLKLMKKKNDYLNTIYIVKNYKYLLFDMFNLWHWLEWIL